MSARVRPEESAAGFVLAGGRSSRMGTDKALVLFRGVPLIQIALRTFSAAGLSAEVAGSRSDLALFARTIPDTFPDSGPLGGIHAAISSSRAEWNIFLPVDMPLMPPPLLACLVQRARQTQAPVTVVQRNGWVEPFPVVLHTSVLPFVEGRLQDGALSCQRAWQTIPADLNSELDQVPVENLLQSGHCSHPTGLPSFLWFRGANTPAELALLGDRPGHSN